jgi:hypothetical protein
MIDEMFEETKEEEEEEGFKIDYTPLHFVLTIV